MVSTRKDQEERWDGEPAAHLWALSREAPMKSHREVQAEKLTLHAHRSWWDGFECQRNRNVSTVAAGRTTASEEVIWGLI